MNVKCGTKTINLAVKRHINRFLEKFMFQLTILPYVFTKQGVAILAIILRTSVSIRIMDAFVTMRHYIGNNEFGLSNIETKKFRT